ncbi:MAG TPA: Gfo/Idh/MocA family oxidoreductase [Acidobacteriaceae bacterium]|jgi:predicted dehydrogenase
MEKSQAPEHSQEPVGAPRSVKRVVVIGAGHYHATAAPGYLHILQNLQLDIVGIHDFDPALARSRAELVGSTAYTDYKTMCEKTRPDFVLSLCRHDMMSEPIRYLINAGFPFMAEKPWGTDPRVVNELANLADKKKSWATFPASMRYSQWTQTCREMVQKNQLGPISHMIVRFNQPGTQRYIDEGSSWMLSKKQAGGGSLLNLGIHGFDLCTYITGEIPKVVAASTGHNISGLDIEDYAFVTLRTPSGMIFINEAGYTSPTAAGDSQRMLSAKNFIVGTPGNVGTTFGGPGSNGAGRGAGGSGAAARQPAGSSPRPAEAPNAPGAPRTGSGFGDSAQVVGPGRNETITAPPGYVGSWPGAVADAIDRLSKGMPPAATAQDNARAVQLTFDAYRMAGERS